ncbi:MAG: hypothetical protein OEL89_00525 [Candidatus Peregrinibacteria bacterium]|nr:hypothetical protein [Candidatus Peregrinibacteria bacterium]
MKKAKFSITLEETIYERFEKERKEKYPLLNRSQIVEQLILAFLGEEVYFK